MYEPDNLREALKTLIDYNTAEFGNVRDGNGKEREARIEDLQDMNLEALYAMCDLLGMGDLIKEARHGAKQKATYDGMDRKKKDDTIIKNGVIQIDAGSIVFAKSAFKACDDQQNLDSSANQE